MNYQFIISELEKCYEELSEIASPKYGKVNWTGLVGALQEMRNDSRFNKLCKIPVRDTNYLNVPGYLLKQIEALKKVIPDNSTDNQYKAEKAMLLIKACYEKWKSTCPGIENCLISDEIGKGVDLPMGLVAEYYLYEGLSGLNYSEKVKQEIKKEFNHQKWRLNYKLENSKHNNGSSGCMGTLLIMTMLGIGSYIAVSIVSL